MLDQVGEHLGVGLRAERVAGRAQPLLEVEIVLEDTVVHHDEAALAVRVRMRVLLRGAPVGRPARVADADRARDGLLAQPSFTMCGARSTTSASSGTSLVITEPAAT